MKRFLSLVIAVTMLLLLSSIFASAEIVLTDENVDSFVGKKIIDESVIVDINTRNMNVNPYKVFSGWNKNAGCVDYICARHWEKLKIHYLVNGGTGNGRDCARNHVNGKQATSLMTGITYTVHTYFNDNGENIKANSWVSFESSIDARGHVIFVEYVKTDSNGVKQIYYTDNVSRGVLKKVSLKDFVSGKIPGNSATTYLGTAWYEASGTSSKQEFSPVADGTYYIVSALNGEKSTVGILGDSMEIKANVHLWERHTGGSQKFKITKSGNYYTFINERSGLALDVDNASTKSGANVWQYTPNGTKAQQWSFEDAGDGYVYIKSALGTYLDVSNGESKDGTNIQVWTGNKTPSQKWRLVKANYVDVNGVLDGKSSGTLGSHGTFDLYVNGKIVADDVNDYNVRLASDATYEIKDIKAKTGYEYKGVSSGNIKGTVGDGVSVSLSFNKAHTHSFSYGNDSAHPHKEYKICACGVKEYTGNTKKVSSCETCYPTEKECSHSVQSMYNEAKHPHKEYGICDECGEKEYTGKTRTEDDCIECNPSKQDEPTSNNPSDIVIDFSNYSNSGKYQYTTYKNTAVKIALNSNAGTLDVTVKQSGDNKNFDPAIIFPKLQFDSKDYRYVIINAKIDVDASEITGMQVFFTTENDSKLSESKSQWSWFTPNKENGFRDFVFDMSAKTTWTGRITSIRVDPYNDYEGKAYIKSIRFTNTLPDQQQDAEHEHTYSKGCVDSDITHPHREYMICDICGYKKYTGNDDRRDDVCDICKDPELTLSDNNSLMVTIPKFDVTINGKVKNNAYAKYPYITYNDITYFPMTYKGARFLGLECNWSQASGLVIKKNALVKSNVNDDEMQSSANYEAYTALPATGEITINGKKIDNSAEAYPVIIFRDVTYFPLTWRFAVTEFGWEYNFTMENGLVINSK